MWMPSHPPYFLYAAPATAACAAFVNESRMRFVNATKLHRKSGLGSIEWEGLGSIWLLPREPAS